MTILLFGGSVEAGFPSPANDYIENALDLNDFLIKRKSSTFIVRVSGDSMIDANIQSGDLLIIDRSKNPVNGSIVVAVVNSEFTVKEYLKRNEKVYLLPRNKKFKPMEISAELDFSIWGVVTFIIHHAEKNNSAS